jgi:hypothetical protein
MTRVDCLFFVIQGEAPEMIRALSRAGEVLIESGTVLEVAKPILKSGGGSMSRDREWTLVSLGVPAAQVTDAFQAVIGKAVGETGEFVTGVEELPVPISSLDQIA